MAVRFSYDDSLLISKVAHAAARVGLAEEVDRLSYLDSQPVCIYTADRNSPPLLVHVIDCGQGNTVLVVLPDQTTILVDCNAVQANGCQDRILGYLGRHIPHRPPTSELTDRDQWIDVFVNTHRDQDHIHGLQAINGSFPILRIVESGVTGAGTSGNEYGYFMELRRQLRKRFGDDCVVVPWQGFAFEQAGVRMTCLNADSADQEGAKLLKEAMLAEGDAEGVAVVEKAAKEQHTKSLVFLIEYAGRKVLLPGDSDYIAWRDTIMPWLANSGVDASWLKSDVLLASHHGSREFFTDTLNETIDPEANPGTTFVGHIEAIRPVLTAVSCGRPDKDHLPNDAALEVYRSHADAEGTAAEHQVLTTSAWGSMTAVINPDGGTSVTPTRFAEVRPAFPAYFDVSLTVVDGANRYCNVDAATRTAYFAPSDDAPQEVLFEASSAQDKSRWSVRWEVSNGGRDRSHSHQECYPKGDKEAEPGHQFRRKVVFRGLHLLRAEYTLWGRDGQPVASYTALWQIHGLT